MNSRLLVVAGLVGLLCSTAFAIDFMGPPTAGLKHGQWDIGFVYSTSEMDLEVSGLGISETLKDIEIDRYYATFGYGIADWWELNARIGASDVDADDLEFSGGTDVAWGLGTKVTFASDEKIDWGALFQVSWINTDDSYSYDLSDYGLGTSQKIEVDAYEMQIAVGPTLKMEGWKLYGGPFLYFVDGDLDATVAGTTYGFDLEEESAFGGYIGGSFDLAENASVAVEYAYTGDGWGMGAGIAWKF